MFYSTANLDFLQKIFECSQAFPYFELYLTNTNAISLYSRFFTKISFSELSKDNLDFFLIWLSNLTNTATCISELVAILP